MFLLIQQITKTEDLLLLQWKKLRMLLLLLKGRMVKRFLERHCWWKRPKEEELDHPLLVSTLEEKLVTITENNF